MTDKTRRVFDRPFGDGPVLAAAELGALYAGQSSRHVQIGGAALIPRQGSRSIQQQRV